LIDRVDAAIAALGQKAPDWKHLDKPILCVDFDGVISEYRNGWHGPAVINEEPVAGAFEWLREAQEHFTVMIFSTRCNFPEGIVAMKEWLCSHGGTDLAGSLIFEPGKPSWFLHIDDRAIEFDGGRHENFWLRTPAVTLLRGFKPWYHSIPGWRHAQEQSKI
jgi:hypothetical protein